ncbi:transcriptional regulator, BolA protein family [Limimonas halophila]|uniref:Transcriptional regulator, BolA protein family n=1 Tax=Limimonas halophila TaxID=1082479 RepID=A0A1G7REW7_9PROT|nr:BolA family protein [Limimonas halophila]SDG08689.1 transcriptional regulator, BolA protein family [Limimonas halophila]
MTMAERIEAKLRDAFTPERLEIADDSHKHRGHSGWLPGGETHFRVTVVSPVFEGVSRVQRQRMIHDALSAELAERVHALQLTARTPAEDARIAGA